MDPVATGRDQDGRFITSGNPRGRPLGARGKATQLLDQMAERGGKAIVQAVMKAAREGDIAAAGLILTRIWPPRRGRPIRFELPDLAESGGAPAALAAIARSTAAGLLSTEEAAEISKVVESYIKATDVVALVNRIERLEAAIVTATAIHPDHSGAAPGATIRRNGVAAG